MERAAVAGRKVTFILAGEGARESGNAFSGLPGTVRRIAVPDGDSVAPVLGGAL